jgi:hypothetical protein
VTELYEQRRLSMVSLVRDSCVLFDKSSRNLRSVFGTTSGRPEEPRNKSRIA